MSVIETVHFDGDGVDLVADVTGPEAGAPILFLHGSGQQRGSWRKAIVAAAARGYRAIAPDLRGHGDSGWSPDGIYDQDRFIADLKRVIGQIGRPPCLVGASIGGLCSLVVAATPPPEVRAVIAVDVAPVVKAEGIAEVRGFMGVGEEGFASLEEAADHIAAFTRRPRAASTKSVERNLRERGGRWYWHWDPKFHAQMVGQPPALARSMQLMREAAETLTVPTLMIRGGSSAVVPREGAEAFLKLFPHAEHVDIAGATHMVAGDANDAFNDAVFAFFDRL